MVLQEHVECMGFVDVGSIDGFNIIRGETLNFFPTRSPSRESSEENSRATAACLALWSLVRLLLVQLTGRS
jgi:hypothetical protein